MFRLLMLLGEGEEEEKNAAAATFIVDRSFVRLRNISAFVNIEGMVDDRVGSASMKY